MFRSWCIASLALAGCASAQEPPQNAYVGGTATAGETLEASDWLAGKFETMLERCDLETVMAPLPRSYRLGIRREAPRSIVPSDIWGSWSADTPLIPVSNSSLSRYFDTVHNENATDIGTIGSPQSWIDDRQPLIGYNTVTFFDSCESTLAAILRSESGFRLVDNEIEAVLALETNREELTNLSIVIGTFESPTVRSWHEQLPSSDPAYIPLVATAMRFAKWYRENPQRIGQRNSLVSRIEAFVVYEWARATRERSVRSNGRLDLSLFGFAGASGTVEAQAQRAGTSTIQSYEVARIARTPLDYFELPTLPQLRRRIDDIGQPELLTAEEGLVLRSSERIRFTLFIRDLPANVCQRSSWESTGAHYTLGNVDEYTLEADEVSGCRFHLRYAPTPEHVESGHTGDVVLRYEVVEDEYLEFPARSVAFTSRTTPRIHSPGTRSPISYRRSDEPAPGDFVHVQWTVPYRLEVDSDMRLMENGITVPKPSLVCDRPRSPYIEASEIELGTVNPASNTADFLITFRATLQSSEVQGGSVEVCRLNGSVEFDLGASGQVSRDFGAVPLEFPVAERAADADAAMEEVTASQAE